MVEEVSAISSPGHPPPAQVNLSVISVMVVSTSGQYEIWPLVVPVLTRPSWPHVPGTVIWLWLLVAAAILSPCAADSGLLLALLVTL